MKMKVLVLLMSVTVLSMGSSVIAAFSENFEGMTTADLTVSPWSTPLSGSAIATGLGTNTTNVVDMDDYESVRVALDAGSQYQQGVLEFDWYQGEGRWSRIFLQDASGWNVAWFHIWGNGGGVSREITDNYNYSKQGMDVIANGTWNHIKVVWDTSANDGAGSYSVYVNGVIAYADARCESGKNYAGAYVARIQWQAYSGYANKTQLDNVTITASDVPYINGSTGLAGVTLSGLPDNPVSLSDGAYSVAVPSGWRGTVTPTLAGYIFTPNQRVYSNVTQSQYGQNYTGSTPIISGNAGVGGATMNGLPGNPVSLGDGSYSAVVPWDWSGTVTPTLAGYTFNPTQRVYSNVTVHLTGQNYTASLAPTSFLISGNVGYGGVTLSGLPGDPVSLIDGSYSAVVEQGWSGTVIPTFIKGIAFSPSQRVYSNVMANYTGQDYAPQVKLGYFFENFDEMTTADLDIAPWSRPWSGAAITTGLGTNATKVVDMDDYESVRVVLDANSQHEQGFVEFDWYQGPGRWSKIAIQDTEGWNIAYFHIWGNGGGVNREITDYYNYSKEGVDMIVNDAWNHIKVVWDTSGNEGAGTYSVYANDVLAYADANSEPGKNYAGESVGRIFFMAYSGWANKTQLDNVKVGPRCPNPWDGDFNKDCAVNLLDLDYLANAWLTTVDQVNVRISCMKNPLIYAPQIAAIAVDGDFSDWASASDWAQFGWWFQGGLLSTTRAKYAWNDLNDVLYIGIESTEEQTLILEVGGLMGTSDANAVPNAGTAATQIEFSGWSSGEPTSVINQPGGTLSGVDAAYTYEGGTMTIEIAMPIYSDWNDVDTRMNLSPPMDIYEYANIFYEDYVAGDSQVADGTYVNTYDSPTMEVGSLIRLIQSLPRTCDDIPNVYKNWNVNLKPDCAIDFGDVAVFVQDWLEPERE